MSRSLTVLCKDAGGPRLMTAFEATAPVSLEMMAAALALRLPVYMRPASLIEMTQLPMNANGKVDRLAVQRTMDELARNTVQKTEGKNAAPSPPSEDGLRQIWARVLGHRHFLPSDNFFDLGGTSLQLIRVQADIAARHGLELALPVLFEHPTIAGLARHLAGGATTTDAVSAARQTGDRQRSAQQAAMRLLRTRGGQRP